MLADEMQLTPVQGGELVLDMLDQTFCRDEQVMARVRKNANAKLQRVVDEDTS